MKREANRRHGVGEEDLVKRRIGVAFSCERVYIYIYLFSSMYMYVWWLYVSR